MGPVMGLNESFRSTRLLRRSKADMGKGPIRLLCDTSSWRSRRRKSRLGKSPTRLQGGGGRGEAQDGQVWRRARVWFCAQPAWLVGCQGG